VWFSVSAEATRRLCAGRAGSAMAMAALLPCTWRRIKYRPAGLQKAAHYNGIEGVVLGVKPAGEGGGSRVIVRLGNDDANELLLKRENMELVNATALTAHEPELARALERLQLCCSPEIPASAEGMGGAARNLVQGILDVTFPLESRLVDDSFEDMDLFHEILDMLASVESVCARLAAAGRAEGGEDASAVDNESAAAAAAVGVRAGGPDGRAGGKVVQVGRGVEDGTFCMVSWLGEGMAECVHWRRGALLYMLVATLAADNKEIDLELLDEGLRQLDKMVATRSSRMAEGLERADGEDSVRTMIAAGILSDTHLLAVVYSGEMCYWAHEALLRGGSTRSSGAAHRSGRFSGEVAKDAASQGQGDPAGTAEPEFGVPSDGSVGYRERGVRYLKRYLTAVEIMSANGPGSVGYGWDTLRASDLLSRLEEARSSEEGALDALETGETSGNTRAAD